MPTHVLATKHTLEENRANNAHTKKADSLTANVKEEP